VKRVKLSTVRTTAETECVVDCKNCRHGHACCRTYAIPLSNEEAERFQRATDGQGKELNILARRDDGTCVYWDDDTKLCTIWDRRPDVCRRYDCRKDHRLLQKTVERPLQMLTLAGFSGRLKVVMSVSVVDVETKLKVMPMMVVDPDNLRGADKLAVEGIQIINEPDKLVESAVDALRELLQKRLEQEKSDE